MKHQWFKGSFFAMLLVFLVSSACSLTNIFRDPSQDVEQQVAATVEALKTQQAVAKQEAAPTPTKTQVPQATISGQLSYPSEFLPPQRIVAMDVNDRDTYFVTEGRADGTYTVEVPPGTYFILAYLMDPAAIGAPPGLAGAYSQAVVCGLRVACEDHSLVPVAVMPGQAVTGIDPADWYLPIEQSADWPGDPTKGDTGTISGSLGYPSEFIPPLRVVAFNMFSKNYYYVDTQRNQAEYQISELPEGTYQVVAFVREEGPDFAGGYSHFVTCGMMASCNNHQLVEVNVYAGTVVEDVDPVDFYMQPGEANWPEDPTQ